MRKFLALSLALCMVCSAASAQDNDFLKRPTLGINFFLNDFNTAATIRSSSVSAVFRDKSWSKLKKMIPGIAVNYMQGVTNHIDIRATLGGSFLDYPIPNKQAFLTDNLLLEADIMANVKLTSDKYWISPYFTGGVGASKYKGYYSAYVPLGVGMQFNFYDDAFLFVSSQYRIPVTENANYYISNSIGVAGNIGKPRAIPEPIAVPVIPAVEKPKDSDSDGIIDTEDDCPTVAGLAAFKGCPDGDGDGIADKDDKCPTVAGTAKYQGCPVPDTDADGLNDEDDKCPAVAGVARYQGCPVPDADKDGINDEEDKCPQLPGVRENDGCPVVKEEIIKKVEFAAKNIFFATGSTKLLPKSFKPLNEVATIMSENPDLQLNVEGHTDNTGKAETNQLLSEQRAEAVAAYLKSKGVSDSRLKAAGFGPDQPVVENKTAAGRAKNRRVELKISY
jgi:OmpA-OmpF porin, OOP family